MIQIASTYAATCMRLPGARHTMLEAYRDLRLGQRDFRFDPTDPASPIVIGRVMESGVLELARMKLEREEREPIQLYYLAGNDWLDVLGNVFQEETVGRGCRAEYGLASCHPDALLIAPGSRRIWVIDAKTSRLWDDWHHGDIPDPVVAQLIHTFACLRLGYQWDGYDFQPDALVAVALSFKGGVQLRRIPMSDEWLKRWWVAIHWFSQTYLEPGIDPPAETLQELPKRYPDAQGERAATPAEWGLIREYHDATEAAKAATDRRDVARDALAASLQADVRLYAPDGRIILSRVKIGTGSKLVAYAHNLPPQEANDGTAAGQ